MGLQRHSRPSGVILLTAVLIATLAAVGYRHARSTPDTPSGVRVAVVPQPAWHELTTEQQRILAPLKDDWDAMSRFRQKKWLEIAARYPNLSEAEQERLRDRMQTWINLTPEQRQAARERFKALNQQTDAEGRDALAQKWADYQNLPEDVRQRLEQEARDKEKADKRAARALAVTPVSSIKTAPAKASTPPNPLNFGPAGPKAIQYPAPSYDSSTFDSR